MDVILNHTVLINPKRSREVLESNVYSKYGTTFGVLSTARADPVDCGFVCTGWPNWAWAAYTRGWNVALIKIKDSSWGPTIRTLFPSACVLTYALGLNPEEVFGKIKIWFSEIDPPRSLALTTIYKPIRYSRPSIAFFLVRVPRCHTFTPQPPFQYRSYSIG